MAVDLTTIRWLAERGEARACIEAAQELLRDSASELEPAELVEVHYQLCASLYKQEDFPACINAGLVAAHLAEQAEAFDFVGKILLLVSGAQYFCNRLPDAIHSLERLLTAAPRFSPESRNLEPNALLNMGTYLGALGKHEEALSFFRRARIRVQSESPRCAEDCRTNMVAINLRLKRFKEAEALIAEGDRYVHAHPDDRLSACRHLWDKAQFALLSGEFREAHNLAWDALGLSDGYLFECARACLTLAEATLSLGLTEDAVFYGTAAIIAARRAYRADVVEEVMAFLRQRLVMDQEAVERVVLAITCQVSDHHERG